MSGSLLRFLVPAMLASTASADLMLGTYDSPAADSAAVKKVYSADAYSNAASARGLSVADGALTLTTTLVNEPGGQYSAQAGILVPLNRLWTPVDIRTKTAITFRIKGSGAYNVNFSVASDAYPNAKDGVVQVAPVKVTTTWTRQTIALQPTPALAWLSWMEDVDRFPNGTKASVIMDETDPDYNDATRNVAMTVKSLQFAIDPTWKTDSTWSAPVAGVTSLSVDDIVMVGLADEGWVVNGVGCTGGLPSMTFASNKTQTNAAGGYWFSYTDSNASGQSKGTSSLVLPEGWTKWRVDTVSSAAKLVANLSRPATSIYGGFAGVGTGAPEGEVMNLTGLVSIQFALAVPDGSLLDPEKVAGVHFKVSKASVGDSATHEVVIPASRFVAGGADICVDIEALKMPGWMYGKPEYKLFTPEDVTKLSWEIKMEDQTGVVTSVPNQGFMVGPVTFYGFSQLPAAGVGPRAAHAPSFAARYQDGTLALQGLDGYASLEVRSLSGARVASLAPSPEVKIRLDRGAYMLVARGAGKPALSRTLAVAR